MKVKSLFAAVLFSFTTLCSAAQGQLRAGINLANVSVNSDGRVDKANTLTSFQVGFIGELPLGTKFISIQPGLVLTGKGSKTESGTSNDRTYYKATTNPLYLEVPVNLVLKAPLGKESRFFAGAGPYLAVGIGGKNKVEGRSLVGNFNSEKSIEFSNDDPSTLNYEEGAGFGIIRRFDYGLNGVAGIEGKSVVLGVNYGIGLAKLQSGANNSSDDNNKHRVLSLTLGFKL